MRRVLTDYEQQVLNDERQQLSALNSLLMRLDAAPEDLGFLERAARQLDELFLLVIVGEFNSGKSAFINALLGERFLPEGVTPTTSQIHIIKQGPEATQTVLDSDVLLLTYPIEWLQDINIVDTPGTNAVLQRHQEITEDFVPRADLILFVTSADRPFSESERAFMQRIRDWGKNVIVVVNKVDILETEADVADVLAFIRENGQSLLGHSPVVFPISARLARQAKEASDGENKQRLWHESRFEPLENYILHTLDESERLRLKLSNPLGVAQRLTAKYLEVARARKQLLGEDVATIENIERQLTSYEADMRRDFKYRLSHVDNALFAMAKRGDRFFDETLRLGRVFDLINTEKIRGAFEREVVADTSVQVEAHTQELIDWMVEEDYRQWQGIMDYLGKRIARHEDEIIGQVGGQFQLSRQQLLQSVGRAARDTVSSYDKDAEAKALAESVQMAVAQTALVEAGAIGLGTLLVNLLATTLADVTGVLAAGTIAALGFYVIPNKRRKAKNDLDTKITALRSRLNLAMTTEFEREMSRSLERIRAAMRPYTRFVETQRSILNEIENSLSGLASNLLALKGKVEEMPSDQGTRTG